MEKIGRDIVAIKPTQSIKAELNSSKFNRNFEYRTQILEFLRGSKRPINIAELSRATKINYMTARSILMELLLAGEVERFESGQCLFYQIKK